jgi:chloramphenicol-sensitive protein RarD
MLQYIAPTMLFLSATLVFHEPIDAGRMLGFGFIWTALLIYTADGLRRPVAS